VPDGDAPSCAPLRSSLSQPWRQPAACRRRQRATTASRRRIFMGTHVMSVFRSAAIAAIALSPLAAAPAWACASCGCVTTSWDTQGFTVEPGWRFELRYDYLDQHQLRSGTGVVDRSAIALPTDRETEQYTTSHILTFSADYSPHPDWGVRVEIPFLQRTHGTIAEDDTDISYSKTAGLADVRVIGRYQGFFSSAIVGVQLGLKLPTGGFHNTFNSGPQAGGPLDRGLQPGTGTTDLLVGAYHFGNIGTQWTYFASFLAQVPLGSREDYKPGVIYNGSVGIRYVGWSWLIPQLQLNGRILSQDTGSQADTANSGGKVLYIAPTITIPLKETVSVYATVQVPIYQNLNGNQLAPRFIVSTGARVFF
jgi:hypothetical protein